MTLISKWHEQNGRHYRFRRTKGGGWIVEVRDGATSREHETRAEAEHWVDVYVAAMVPLERAT